MLRFARFALFRFVFALQEGVRDVVLETHSVFSIAPVARGGEGCGVFLSYSIVWLLRFVLSCVSNTVRLLDARARVLAFAPGARSSGRIVVFCSVLSRSSVVVQPDCREWRDSRGRRARSQSGLPLGRRGEPLQVSWVAACLRVLLTLVCSGSGGKMRAPHYKTGMDKAQGRRIVVGSLVSSSLSRFSVELLWSESLLLIRVVPLPLHLLWYAFSNMKYVWFGIQSGNKAKGGLLVACLLVACRWSASKSKALRGLRSRCGAGERRVAAGWLLLAVCHADRPMRLPCRVCYNHILLFFCILASDMKR